VEVWSKYNYVIGDDGVVAANLLREALAPFAAYLATIALDTPDAAILLEHDYGDGVARITVGNLRALSAMEQS